MQDNSQTGGGELGDQLCEVAAHVHAGMAELALLCAEFDESEAWAGLGFRSAAHWLSVYAGLDLRSSYELVRVGKALPGLPGLAQALASGQLSFDKARVLSQVARAEDEQIWVELARELSASQLARVGREYRRALEVEEPERAELQLARRGLWGQWREDGMLRLVALLPPEEGELVLAALESVAEKQKVEAPTVPSGEQAAVPDPAGQGDPWAARQVDALVAVCEQALAAGAEHLGSAPEARRLVVHVDVGVLTGEATEGRCHLENGPALSRAAALRLGCDAELVAVTERGGVPIDLGRSRRLVSRRLRLAQQVRDRGCTFPGCGVPARRTEAHHLHHWALGGRTDLSNLVGLCAFHHRRHHQGAFSIRPRADGGLAFETRAGLPIGQVSARGGGRDQGAAGLRRLAGQQHPSIGPQTPNALTYGETVNHDLVISGLIEHCRAAARAGPAP